MGAASRHRHTLGDRYVDAAGTAGGVDVIENERTERWTYERESGNRDSPYTVRSGRQVVCRVRTAFDADSICSRRTAALREAGQRAADLRRHRLELKQLKDDVRALMQTLQDIGQVLKLIKPRDVIRAREDVRRILRRMQGRGYTS